MTAIQWDLIALQGNDETYNFTIYYGPTPLNLTGLVPTFYLKQNRTAPDFDSMFKYSPTVTDAFLGEISVTIPRANIESPGAFWYRIDVNNPNTGLINTLIFGVLTVLSV